jgi:hypothetical protein
VNTAEILAAFAGQDAVFLAALVIAGKVALRAVDRARLVGPPKAPAQADADAGDRPVSILERGAGKAAG